jgi:hypothetical protein
MLTSLVSPDRGQAMSESTRNTLLNAAPLLCNVRPSRACSALKTLSIRHDYQIVNAGFSSQSFALVTRKPKPFGYHFLPCFRMKGGHHDNAAICPIVTRDYSTSRQVNTAVNCMLPKQCTLLPVIHINSLERMQMHALEDPTITNFKRASRGLGTRLL